MKRDTIAIMVGMLVVAWAGMAGAQGWYDPAWMYRKALTIDATKVAGPLTDFPVLIYRSADASLAAHALASGADLVFTSADGVTKLSREIEGFDSATGQLWCWVKVPQVSATENTRVYLYYGNAAGSETDARDTWDDSFRMVYHLKDTTSSTVTDSCGNFSGNKYTAGNPAEIDSKIGKGQSFDVSYIDTTDGNLPLSEITVSYWVRGTEGRPFGYADDWQGSHGLATYTGGWIIRRDGDDLDIPCGNWANNQWHYLVLRLGAAEGAVAYLDGAQAGSNPSATSFTTCCDTNLAIGACFAGELRPGINLGGAMDEFRVSNVVRSEAWINTEYANQYNPASFISIGGEEQPPTATPTDTPYFTATPTDTPTPVSQFIVESQSGGSNFEAYSEVGQWTDGTTKSTAPGTTHGIGCRAAQTDVMGRTARFSLPDSAPPGEYGVYITWQRGTNRATQVQVTLDHDTGQVQQTYDQSKLGNVWHIIGDESYQLRPGRYVEITTTGAVPADTGHFVIADAVWFSLVGPEEFPTKTPSPTPSDTPTVTPTATITDTPTDTPTATPSGTPTDTPAITPSDTPTDTPTYAPTATKTANELGIAARHWEQLP